MPAHRVKSLESKYALTEEVRSNRESEEVVGVSEDKSSENFEEEGCTLNKNEWVYVHSSDEHEQCDMQTNVGNCNHVVGHENKRTNSIISGGVSRTRKQSRDDCMCNLTKMVSMANGKSCERDLPS